MVQAGRPLTFGLPRLHNEAGERRDFLPALVHELTDMGVEVAAESGIGSGVGLTDADYQDVSSLVHIVDNDEAFRQDIVMILRSPEGLYERLRRRATLISMLHFPTRPQRVRLLRELGLERSIAMDCIVDDQGRRLVEDSRGVAWNGLEAAFDALERTWPEIPFHDRPPVRVTIMGAGEIGRHAVEAATKFGRLERNHFYMDRRLPGVEVVTLGRNMTGDAEYMRERLRLTDILVDATQRHDPSRPLVPNEWLADLPEHAVICDLVVDPYQLTGDPPTVRGIEGIPQGNLDRYAFFPDDPAWDELPPEIPAKHRRTVVSCYSWPGVHPLEGMELYGIQLSPLLQTLIERGGVDGLRAGGTYHERALRRGTLRWWAPPA